MNAYAELLRHEAILMDLRNRLVAFDPDWAPVEPDPNERAWACECGATAFMAPADNPVETVCLDCGTFPTPDPVPLDPKECPACYSVLPKHGRGCYLDPANLQ